MLLALALFSADQSLTAPPPCSDAIHRHRSCCLTTRGFLFPSLPSVKLEWLTVFLSRVCTPLPARRKRRESAWRVRSRAVSRGVTVTLSSPPSRVLQLLYLWPPRSPAITTAPTRTCTRIRATPAGFHYTLAPATPATAARCTCCTAWGPESAYERFHRYVVAMSIFFISLLLTLFSSLTDVYAQGTSNSGPPSTPTPCVPFPYPLFFS